MISMRDLANHIIAVAENNGGVTNLQLQKIMFFIFGKNLQDLSEGKSIAKINYDLPFSRWTYGPVVEDIYFSYNKFGPSKIKDSDAVECSELSSYKTNIIHLLRVEPFQLVEITHRLPSWKNYEEKILRREYVPDYLEEDIAEGFVKN